MSSSPTLSTAPCNSGARVPVEVEVKAQLLGAGQRRHHAGPGGRQHIRETRPAAAGVGQLPVPQHEPEDIGQGICPALAGAAVVRAVGSVRRATSISAGCASRSASGSILPTSRASTRPCSTVGAPSTIASATAGSSRSPTAVRIWLPAACPVRPVVTRAQTPWGSSRRRPLDRGRDRWPGPAAHPVPATPPPPAGSAR